MNLSPNFQANEALSYRFDKDFSTIFNINKKDSFYCLYVDNSNDLLSLITYEISKYIISVFSIGNGENDWRIFLINFNNNRIEFYIF